MYEARYLSYCADGTSESKSIKNRISKQQSLRSALKEVDDTEFEDFIRALEQQHEIWLLLHSKVWFAACAPACQADSFVPTVLDGLVGTSE